MTAVPAQHFEQRRAWLVSVALPIEAASASEAVREFWTYVDTLGSGQLPAFVSPVGDELAMRAYVLAAPGGADLVTPTDLDPEQDDLPPPVDLCESP